MKIVHPERGESLEKLASLLATEDLIVEHASVPTASFDLKTRKVTLPMWKNMDKTLYHMLVLHEIGHALYTPFEEFKGHVDDNDKNLKDYINVIEDARIERKIKLKYPGSRRDFVEGYNTLNKRDFFGCLLRDPNTLNLIDRINLFFKLGSRVEIEFTPEEQAFVDEAETTMTFKDVVDLAKRIYEFSQEQAETAQEHPDDYDLVEDQNQDHSEDSETIEDSGDGEEEEKEGKGEPEEQSDLSAEDSEDATSDSPIEWEGGDGLSAQTVSEFDRNMSERMINESATPTTYYDIDLRELDYKKVVVDYKTLIGEFVHSMRDRENDNDIIWNWFLTKNKNSISYLVKEFEMKKAADQYSRAKSDKTGKVDPNKLYNYKFNDDIFLRNTVTPGAKNHGLVMFVDLSGSMMDNLLGTVTQLLCLVSFCRRVGIPHRVYGFSDCYWKFTRLHERPTEDYRTTREQNGFAPSRGQYLSLLEFFTEKMNNQDFAFMGKQLLEIAFTANCRYGYYSYAPEELKDVNVPINTTIPLGGTPLNESLTYARNLIKDFRKETKSEIVNFVCLTDGGSNSLCTPYGIARDKETRLQSEFHRHHQQTEFLLTILKKTCGVHAINFFVGDRNPWSLYFEDNLKMKEYRKQKMITTHDWLGFDDVHTIMGPKSAKPKEVTMDDAKKIQKGTLARTMIKMGGNRRGSRVILSKFIDRIAA